MSVLLRGVRLYGEGDQVDVLVDDGQIAEIGAGLAIPDDADVIDATGQVLLPGFVDLHTHLREPGREYAEDIETGSAAAALGGFTAVFAMANTKPVADSPVVTDHVWHRGQQVGLVDVHPVGAVTVGLAGTELTEMGMMAAGAAQVRMFSDDGKCVDDPLIMRRALEYATGLGVLIAQHAEEPRLTVGAVAHEGPNAARLGLSGWPRAAEESIVARDALLARDAGARVHICHASTAGTVEIVKWAKSQGISITAEVTPHHLLLDDSRLASYDGVNRVNPPLRETADAVALRQALADGVIDCVATDHAPHAEHEKCVEFAAALPGMLGLQTALSAVVQAMVIPGLLTWRGVARVMSENPARIVGLPDQGRPLEIGEPANLTVVDPDATWTVSGADMASRSANTPYETMTLPATVTATLLRGKITARDGKSPGMNSATLVASLIMAGVLALLIAFIIQLMMRGWRKRARRQAELIGTLPPMPEMVGSPIVAPTRGMYVGCTLAPGWHDRVVVGDLGYRSKAVLTRYTEGILVERSGASPIWIPQESITAIRTERGMVGKVVPAGLGSRRARDGEGEHRARTTGFWRSGGACRRAPRSISAFAATTAASTTDG